MRGGAKKHAMLRTARSRARSWLRRDLRIGSHDLPAVISKRTELEAVTRTAHCKMQYLTCDGGRGAAEIEMPDRIIAEVSLREIEQHAGGQWAMDHQAPIAFVLPGIGQVIVDTVAVECERRKPEQQRFRGNDHAVLLPPVWIKAFG